MSNQLGEKKLGRILLFMFFEGIFMFVLMNQLFGVQAERGQFLSPVSFGTPIPPPTPEFTESKSLENMVKNVFSQSEGSYGLVIKNITTKETYSYNEHRVFEPGSLYKLWIMAVAYSQIEAGTLKKDTVLSQDATVLNKKFGIASASAEIAEGTVRFTVEKALQQMITISDNYAALLLTEKVKLLNVSTFLKEHGFDESQIGSKGDPPTSTTSDIALFLEKLYGGKLANKENTEAMITLLKQQKLNNKLPKYLHDSIQIAHKTGEIDSYTHDAGIVYLPAENYIIVVLSESDDPEAAEEHISKISKEVYEYFTNK